VIVVVPLQEPWLGVEDTNVMFAGSVSVTDTEPALSGPAFATLMSKVTSVLIAYAGEAGEAVFVIDRSEEFAATVVVVVLLLFPAFGSADPAEMVAVFEMTVPIAVAGAT